MKKKIIFLIVIVLLFVAGGIFWWWENQKDVRELNKNLPEGVKVVKDLFGEEYRVVNKIDGYEFKVPKEWEGVKKITYYPPIETEKKPGGISIDAQNGDMFGIGMLRLENDQISLESWVQERIIKSNPSFWKVEKQFFDNTETMKLIVQKKPLSEFPSYYFKKDSKIYYLSGPSEELIGYIIINGKW